MGDGLPWAVERPRSGSRVRWSGDPEPGGRVAWEAVGERSGWLVLRRGRAILWQWNCRGRSAGVRLDVVGFICGRLAGRRFEMSSLFLFSKLGPRASV
jgi:hypothetical protein